MGSNLYQAAAQWSNRPLDERFWTLKEAAAVCKRYRDASQVMPLDYSKLRCEAYGDDLYLQGKQGASAKLTNYAFGQLASKTKAPAAYLRKLPPTLAAQNLNHGLKLRGEDVGENIGKLLVQGNNGDMVARAALGGSYVHLWNTEVFERCQALEAKGWRVPPGFPVHNDPRARPATQADLIDCANVGCQINVGDMIGPSGVYASDHDAFVFLVNDAKRIDDGTPEGLVRFIMLWNSEVGDKSFGGIAGLFKGPCGNHIVWDVSDAMSFRLTHVGRVRERAFKSMSNWMARYGDESASSQEEVIREAKQVELGKTRIDVMLALTKRIKKAKLPLPLTVLESAYEHAEQHEKRYQASPRSVWGMVQGVTAVGARALADKRTVIDRAAGKILEMSF